MHNELTRSFKRVTSAVSDEERYRLYAPERETRNDPGDHNTALGRMYSQQYSSRTFRD